MNYNGRCLSFLLVLLFVTIYFLELSSFFCFFAFDGSLALGSILVERSCLLLLLLRSCVGLPLFVCCVDWGGRFFTWMTFHFEFCIESDSLTSMMFVDTFIAIFLSGE